MISVGKTQAVDSFPMEFQSALINNDLIDNKTTIDNAYIHEGHLVRVAICYGLYPGVCSVVVSHVLYLLP